jgi:transcription-repair coupling factor (superfamily II helicase)
VRSLLALAAVRAQASAVGLTEVVCFAGRVRLAPVAQLPESKQVRLDRLYPGAIWKQAEQSLLVPLPSGDGRPPRPGQPPVAPGVDLPAWLSELLTSMLDAPPAPALPAGDRHDLRRAAS